jgi:hypothetical protein
MLPLCFTHAKRQVIARADAVTALNKVKWLK